ncbi:hypothetical protein Tco_0149114 [Tanacetum coccineum]
MDQYVLVEGRSKGGDGVGNDIGRSGGVPDGGVFDGSITDRGDGSGSGWEVDGDSALNRIIAVLKVGYGITDTWDEMVEDMYGTPAATDVAGLSQRMTDFVTTVRQDTDEIYRRLDDAQDDRLLMSGQLNMPRRDRRAHAYTARLMETEARLSREAWVQSMDASDTARSEVRALQTTVLAQQAKIGALRATDRTRQA